MPKQVRTEAYVDPAQPWRVEVDLEAIALSSRDISRRLMEENGVYTPFMIPSRHYADERLSNLIHMGGISQCYHRDQQPRKTLKDRVIGFLINQGFIVRRAHV